VHFALPEQSVDLPLQAASQWFSKTERAEGCSTFIVSKNNLI
jgi:hypothetical protein